MFIEHYNRFFDTERFELSCSAVEGSGEVVEGIIRDRKLGKDLKIVSGIPRMIADDHYSQSFGDQWNRYRKVQIDKFNGYRYSEHRFSKERDGVRMNSREKPF
jgi:hypothetical protein